MDIETLRSFCLSLPNATEDVKWGADLCFCIREKMFCVTGLEGSPMKVSLKVTPEEYDELVGTDDIISAPYVGRYKWILIQHPDRFSDKEWKRLVRQSYDLIAPASGKTKARSVRSTSGSRKLEKPRKK